MADKEVEKLRRQIERWPGWTIKETRNGYLAIPPDPNADMVLFHKTPRSPRWRHHTIANLRRSGAPI